MNPMKNGQVFAKKCLVRFLSANHLTIEACTWARQSNRQQKRQGMSKRLVVGEGWKGVEGVQATGCQHKSKGKGKRKENNNWPKGETEERKHKKSFLIPKVSVSASSMAAEKCCLLACYQIEEKTRPISTARTRGDSSGLTQPGLVWTGPRSRLVWPLPGGTHKLDNQFKA